MPKMKTLDMYIRGATREDLKFNSGVTVGYKFNIEEIGDIYYIPPPLISSNVFSGIKFNRQGGTFENGYQINFSSTKATLIQVSTSKEIYEKAKLGLKNY